MTGQFSATIALGMGTAASLVSLMLALGYQPLPYCDPARLVAVWERTDSGAEVAAISGPDLADFADATHNTFSALGGFAAPQGWLLDHRGATQVRACNIQASIFSDLGIRPVLGRGAEPGDEGLAGGAGVPVWISYELWHTRYGGNPSVIGATIQMASTADGHDQQSMRVAGVLPHGVGIPLPFMQNVTDIWYVLPREIAAFPRQAGVFFGVGRLRPGVSAGPGGTGGSGPASERTL